MNGSVGGQGCADEDEGAPQAQSIDRRRPRRKAAVQRQIEHRRHHERHDGEEQHGRGVRRRRSMKFLGSPSQAAGKKRQAEYEQEVADDAARNGGFDERDVSIMERDNRDDQFRGIPERGVEQSTERGAGSMREMFRAEADQSGERNERHRGRQKYPGRSRRHEFEQP